MIDEVATAQILIASAHLDSMYRSYQEVWDHSFFNKATFCPT